ncbi:MAG TPA: hypothetical protein PKH07_20645, partial [bacterium]|nr:hypothetical protein [bacterium]
PSNILDFSPKPVSHPLPLESDPAITRQALKVIDCVLDAPEQQDSPFVNAFGDISDDLLLEIIQMVLFAEPSPAMEASACLSLLPTRKVDIMLDTLLRSPNIDPVRRCILETIVKERNEAYKLLGQEGFALNLPENPEVALRRLIERTEEIDLPIEEAWALLSEEAMVSCIDLGYQATIPAFGRLLAHVADLVPTSVALKILQKMTQVSQKHLSLLVRALAMHPDERVRNALRAQEKWLTKHGISLNEILFCESKQPEVQVYLCSTEASGQYTMLVNQRSSLQRLRSVFFHIDTWLQGLCLTQGTSCAMVSDDVAKMRVAEFLEDQGVHAVEQTDISLARARRII